MSSINNIPFDINRVPSEKNAVPAKGGPKPVLESEAIHPAEPHSTIGERRKRKDRRKKQLKVAHERRHLLQRRSTRKLKSKQVKDDLLNPQPGHIIDFEV